MTWLNRSALRSMMPPLGYPSSMAARSWPMAAAGRVVELPRQHGVAREVVSSGRVHAREAVLAIDAEVDARAEAVLAAEQRPGRLERIDVRVDAARERVAEIAERHASRPSRSAGSTGCCRSTALAAVGKPRLAGSKIPWFWRMLGSWNRDQLALHVQQRRIRHRPDVIDVERVVDAEQEIARRLDAVELAGPVAAVLDAVVARVADEEALLVRQDVVDAVVHRVEVVAARVGADVVVAALRVSRLVGHRVIAHVVAPDLADAVRRDDVSGERLALDASIGASARR